MLLHKTAGNHPLQSKDAVLFPKIAFRRAAMQVSLFLCALRPPEYWELETKGFREWHWHYYHGVT